MDISPYDAIVVGSGATGGIAALTLAEQGIKVLVIEAGPQVKRHEASNYEPKSTFKRLSGVLTKKHANQCQHPGYWKIILTYIQMNWSILMTSQQKSHFFGPKVNNMGGDH